MGFGGAFLRFGVTLLYFLEFCCAAIILGIYSFFLASLSHHNEFIAARHKAVEGMSGIAVCYTICGVIFSLCLGGVTFFGFVAILLDIAFAGAFIAIAYYARNGSHSCHGFVKTPLGSGLSSNDGITGHNLGNTCRMESAVFAVAIIGAVLFLLTCFVQFTLVRHHKKEKRFGPSPANNYTSGSGNFFRRRRANRNTRDAELATAPVVNKAPMRASQETGYTGSTQNAGFVDANAPFHHKTTGTATNY